MNYDEMQQICLLIRDSHISKPHRLFMEIAATWLFRTHVRTLHLFLASNIMHAFSRFEKVISLLVLWHQMSINNLPNISRHISHKLFIVRNEQYGLLGLLQICR